MYEGFKAQRRELTDQLNQLENTRSNLASQLEELPSQSTERKALTDRMGDIDARIKSVDGMLATNAIQLSQSAAIPGAVVEPPMIVRQGPPEEVFVLSGMFIVIVLLPLSIALARRIWRRSAAAVSAFPKELADRLMRVEQAVEATSIEVERIGEGQRFLTRLFTEGENARALGAGAAQPIETKQPNARERR